MDGYISIEGYDFTEEEKYDEAQTGSYKKKIFF